MEEIREQLVELGLIMVLGAIFLLALFGGLNLLVGHQHCSERCINKEYTMVVGAPA